MYAEITAAIQSVKTVYDLVKATNGLSNSTDILTAVNDVQMKLSSAIASALASQEKEASLAERVRELEAQLRDVGDWNGEIQRYQLVEFPETKALAYKLKEDAANGEPIYYLCTTCADKKKKTMMQPSGRLLRCPECDLAIETQKAPPIRRNLSSGENWKTV